jgi:hypothetical protein
MEFISRAESQKKKLVSQLKKELLYMGVGPDNSARIDRLNDEIQQAEESIDMLYILYEIPRNRVKITPYAYLAKLSSKELLYPFVDKLDRPNDKIVTIEDRTGKVFAIERDN